MITINLKWKRYFKSQIANILAKTHENKTIKYRQCHYNP